MCTFPVLENARATTVNENGTSCKPDRLIHSAEVRNGSGVPTVLKAASGARLAHLLYELSS